MKKKNALNYIYFNNIYPSMVVCGKRIISLCAVVVFKIYSQKNMLFTDAQNVFMNNKFFKNLFIIFIKIQEYYNKVKIVSYHTY